MNFILALLSRLNPTPFIAGWFETRPWRFALAGIPVIGVVIAVIAIRATIIQANGEAELRHYLAAAGDCFARGDEKGAELRYQRAMIMAPADPRPKFGMALLAEKNKDVARATAIMESLSAGRGEIAIQANKWLVARIMNESSGKVDRSLLIRRLERAVDAEPKNLDLRTSLASAYHEAGFTEQAIEQVKVVVGTRPQARMALVQLLFVSGQRDAAVKEAAEAERYFAERVKKEPGDFDLRAGYSSALVFQKKYQEAIAVLEAGAAVADPVLLRKSVSAVTSAWARDLQSRKNDPRQVLELTSRALKADPSNVTALMTLMDLARDSETETGAVAQLEQLLAAGESPWLVHMILGTRQLELGNTDKGAAHLEQAVKLNPAASVAMNNLAWTLATQEKPDLARAESLVAQAMVLAPGNPQIRETRGQIYLRQERYQEALTDLEAILPVYTREPKLARALPKIHESLAKAYEQLGNAEMAKRHRELAVAKAAPPATPNATRM
ncbi:MAG TPA: tetratricopeptide repeat protein [Caulifigura sp.]|jgi:tetratricopeptide (TPR) repeat protein|nr:tetratricopeptide repeat protein [Caulifigura sp.]